MAALPWWVRRGDLHAELSLHTALLPLTFAADSPTCPCLSVPIRACPCLSVAAVQFLSARPGVRAFLSVPPAPAEAVCPCNRCWRD
jgi:hypothetical protein